MGYVNINGKLCPDDENIFRANNKSYRYGDGLFETMRIFRGRILYEESHFQRLFASLGLLQMQLPKLLSRNRIIASVLDLCDKNNAGISGRVRLSFYRGNGGLLEGDDDASFLIEAWPLQSPVYEWNENGLVLGIYRDARKTTDRFSVIKSASFLPYTMAARYARAMRLNDSIVLNTAGRICDSTIANLFLVKDGGVITPSLEEGCISGVLRRELISHLADNGLIVEEKAVTIEDVKNADEVFLTNVIRGIRWVKQLDDDMYANTFTHNLHRQFNSSVFT